MKKLTLVGVVLSMAFAMASLAIGVTSSGCGDAQNGADGSGGATVGTGGGGSGGGMVSAGSGGMVGSGGAGVCNMLTNIASAVASTSDLGPVPTMTGGPIADGTYVLASFVHYMGVSADAGYTTKATILITGNTTQLVTSGNGGPDEHSTITRGLVSGTPQFNGMVTCGAELPATGSYTATPTTFVFRPHREHDQEDYLVLTYNKQ